MAAVLTNLALEVPVLAAGIWSAGAIFFYGPTYIDKVDSWIHQNGTAPSTITVTPTPAEKEPTKGPETPLKSQKNPADLTQSLELLDKEKSITGTIARPKHSPTPAVTINDQNNPITTTKVVPTHIAEPSLNNTTVASFCDVPAAFRPFWCTLQELGAFSPLANFIYAVGRRIQLFFQFTVYSFLVKPAVNNYPTWRLLVITTSVIGLAIFPCHARRSIYHKWQPIYFRRRLIFSTGVLTTMAHENNPLFQPYIEDRTIISVGVALVIFLDAIVPQGAFTNEWNNTIQALRQDSLVVWASLKFYVVQLWKLLAFPNRYVLGALGLVLLSNYWQEINHTIAKTGPAKEQAARFINFAGRYIVYEARRVSRWATNNFNAVHTATSPYLKYHWNSATRFLEAYNITESRYQLFKERTTLYGFSVLSLCTLSMIPSVFYYLLRFAKPKANFANAFALVLPFLAIIIAGWFEINAANLASVTVGALVDANLYYRGKEWSPWEHFHLLLNLFYFWTIELTMIPLLRAVARLAARQWEISRRRGSVSNILYLALFAGAIGNVPLRWACWHLMGAAACIPIPNVTQIYDDLYHGISGLIIYLSCRAADGWDGFWDFVSHVAGRISTTVYIGSKDLLRSGSEQVTEFCGLVAHSLGNLFQRLNEWRIQNQGAITTVCQILFWAWALYRVCRILGYPTRGRGGVASHPPGHPAGLPGFSSSSPDNDDGNGRIGHQPPPSPAPPSSRGDDIENISQPPAPPIGVVDGGDDGQGTSLPPSSLGGEGEDEDGDGNGSPSPTSSSGDDGDDGRTGNRTPSSRSFPPPRSFPAPRSFPPRLSLPASSDASPPPFHDSRQAPPHGPLLSSSPPPPETTGIASPLITNLTPAEQAAKLFRLVRAEEERLADIKRREEEERLAETNRRKGALLAMLLHGYHHRDKAATIIKQTYRTYKSNKSLKCWKKTVAATLLQAAQNKAMQECVAAVERQLDAEEALLSKMERQLDAEEVRLEAERVEVTRLEATRVKAARVEAARLEATRVEGESIEATCIEAERVEATRVGAERKRREEKARIGTERESKAVQDRLDEEIRLKSVPSEDEAIRKAKDKSIRNEAALKREADREEAARKEAAAKKADEDQRAKAIRERREAQRETDEKMRAQREAARKADEQERGKT